MGEKFLPPEPEKIQEIIDLFENLDHPEDENNAEVAKLILKEAHQALFRFKRKKEYVQLAITSLDQMNTKLEQVKNTILFLRCY